MLGNNGKARLSGALIHLFEAVGLLLLQVGLLTAYDLKKLAQSLEELAEDNGTLPFQREDEKQA
jgi:hypothetical protein